MSLLSAKTTCRTKQAAYEWVEAHLWPDGPVCPHCGSVERISKMAGQGHPLRPLQVLRLPQAVHA